MGRGISNLAEVDISGMFFIFNVSCHHHMAWTQAIKVGDAVGSVRQGFQVLVRAEETRAKPASCTPAPAGWEVGRIFSHL